MYPAKTPKWNHWNILPVGNISWVLVFNDPTHPVCFATLLTAVQFCIVPKEDAKKIRTHPDLPKLAVAETFDELQRLPWDLPHVFGFDGQVGQAGHAFVARHDQSAAQPRSPGWINHAVWISSYIKVV